MTDTLGEDRLLDLGEIERALQQATPGPWIRGARHGTYCTEIVTADGGREVAAVWNYADHFTPGELRPVQKLSPQGEADFTLMQHAPDWLARLCARVRHLEEKLAAADKCKGDLRRELATELQAPQRLTEALSSKVEHWRALATGIREEAARTDFDERYRLETKAAQLEACALDVEALGAGAPPEGEK